MTGLNWVWPPVVLALAVWMFLQVRRSLPRAGRWLLTPVIAVLALASLGGTYANITLARNQDTYAAPGKTYDVGDHRLHLDCRGHGGPTVVLFNGLGGISAYWARITGPVADIGRVCAYDRAGQGWSDDVPEPPGRRGRGQGPACSAGRGRRDRPVRPGRALDRRHLRPELRRPVRR